MKESLTIIRPDDWHLHVRDLNAMQSVIGYSAEVFGRALIMPNLKPPVTTAQHALEYRARVLEATRNVYPWFTPLMTLYLTDATTPHDVEEAAQAGITAFKLYPANATTNSSQGITDIGRREEVFDTMQEWDMVLCIHGETLFAQSGVEVDVFERETVFINEELWWMVDSFPQLRIVLEHITTEDAVCFVESAREGVGATITAHHLLENRNAIFRAGLNPHNYCLPVLKREIDREALLLAATSGNEKFFAGTDSAPHAIETKHSTCGCAGCFTAPTAIELYAEAFESMDALSYLEGFMSIFGARFYGLPRNTDTITLARESWIIPSSVPFGESTAVPFWAGKALTWKKV